MLSNANCRNVCVQSSASGSMLMFGSLLRKHDQLRVANVPFGLELEPFVFKRPSQYVGSTMRDMFVRVSASMHQIV